MQKNKINKLIAKYYRSNAVTVIIVSGITVAWESSCSFPRTLAHWFNPTQITHNAGNQGKSVPTYCSGMAYFTGITHCVF